MMLTKLAHGTGTKQRASNKPYTSLRDQKDFPARQFSPNFGDFLTICLQTDPKQVSLEQLHVAHSRVRHDGALLAACKWAWPQIIIMRISLVNYSRTWAYINKIHTIDLNGWGGRHFSTAALYPPLCLMCTICAEANNCSAAGSSLHQKNEERIRPEKSQASLRSLPAVPERKKESLQRAWFGQI